MGYVVRPIKAIKEDEVEGTAGQHLYMVRCRGNFWGGKYYEDGLDSIVVAAGSPDEAFQIANSNIDAVVEHFHNKKLGARKRPALRRKDNKVKVTDTTKELSQTAFHKVLSSNGTFGSVNVAEGLGEDAGDIKSKDPKVSQMLKKARINYAGRADDDLSALVSMMGDEQDVQDKELSTLDHHNDGQDVELDQEEHTNIDQEEEIMDLQSRVAKLEQRKGTTESINEAEHSEAVNQVLLRLQAAGGKVYEKAILKKGDETAMLAQNGNIRFAIFQDGKVKRAKKFIEFQRDGWEIEMNLDEEIVPYREKDGNRSGTDDYYDDETGEIFRSDQVEKSEDGKMVEKPYQADTSSTDYGVGQYDDDEDEHEGGSLTTTWAEVQAKKKGGGHQAQAVGMFGDIAAGGGDPIDHLMTELGMSMEQIDVLAKENGYDDANEWAESYQMHESIISSFKKLDRR